MANVKGKDNYTNMPQLNGVEIIPPAGTLGQVLAKASVTDYDLEWIDQSGTGGGTPSAPVGSLQFNTAGTFDGSADMIRNDADRTLEIRGVDATNMVNIGGDTLLQSGTTTAPLYVEVVSDGGEVDGLTTFFNRTNVGISASAWISYAYDGATPYIKMVDEDDDPPYISFQTVGTGTPTAPQFESSFGSFGPLGDAALGFSWKQANVEIATLQTGFFTLTGNTGTGVDMINTSADQFSRSVIGMTNTVAGVGGVDRRLWLLEKDDIGAVGESTLTLRRENGFEFLDYLRIEGANNNISLNAIRTTGAPAYGDVRVENGNLVIATGQLQQEAGTPSVGNVLTAENTSGLAAWRPRLEIVKATNTNTTSNFNTTIYTIIPLCGTLVFNNGVSGLYTVDTVTHRITVAETGWYKVSYGMYIQSPGARNSLNVQVHINGLPVGTIQSTYIRINNDHFNDSAHGDELFPITAGQQVDVRSVRNSTNGSPTTLGSSGTSFLSLERVE
jgi:hypothetical protein